MSSSCLSNSDFSFRGFFSYCRSRLHIGAKHLRDRLHQTVSPRARAPIRWQLITVLQARPKFCARGRDVAQRAHVLPHRAQIRSGTLRSSSLTVPAYKTIVTAHQCGWIGLIAILTLSEEIRPTGSHRIVADESVRVDACPCVSGRSRCEEALSLGMMYPTGVVGHASRMSAFPIVQFAFGCARCSRSIVLHSHEVTATERSSRLLSLRIEKRVLKSARAAKRPAPPCSFTNGLALSLLPKDRRYCSNSTTAETALASG